MTDGEIEQLRDQLSVFARVALTRFPNGKGAPFKGLSEADLADAEERAAIAEFDAGIPRKVAERVAITRKRKST